MSTKNETTDLSQFGLGILVREAYFSIRRCSNSICQQFDCNGDQFVVLKYLVDEGPMVQKRLCELSGHDSSTIASMVRVLEKSGMITRKSHPEDSRAKLVTITRKGRSVQKKLWEQTEQMRKQLWSCIPKSEREGFTNGLRKISEKMDELREQNG